MTPPTVSVIIPAFNASDTLQTALYSVQRQSFRRWEAVVIDDGSKDRTAEVVASLASADGRIRYHQTPFNRGPSAARNAGLAKAQGEFVMFLDADDWIGKDHISRLVHVLRHDPLAGGAYTGHTIATEGGGHQHSVSAARPESLFRYAARACPFSINACLVKRHLVQEVRGFDESLLVAEEWDLWQRLARGSVKFLPIDACSAFYRPRDGSQTRASGRLIRDGSTVIRRGHSPDARVRNTKPEHDLGEPVADLPGAMLSFLIWANSYLAGAGSTLPPLSDYLPKAAVQGFDETIVTPILFDGLMQGVGWRGAGLAACWAEVWPTLARSLEPVYSCSATRLDKDSIRRKVERLLVNELGPEDAPRTVGHIHVVRAQFEDAWTAIGVPNDVELVRVYPSLDDRAFDVADLEVVPGTLSRRELAAFVLKKRHSIFDPETRRFIRKNPRLLRQLVGRRTLYFLWDLMHVPRSRWRRRVSAYLSTRINSYLVARIGLAQVQARPQERSTFEEQAPNVAESDPEQKRWEKKFATPDPWSYGSGYEQRKYEHTLELLPDRPIGCALELACAEGHFTAQLAPRVGHLVAADISERALSRARQRCREFQNITFRRLNLRRDLFGRFDLIVCSEVLYFLNDRFELRRLASRLAESLNPGGHLLMAHANLLVDDNGATGFDWMHGFGAKFIGKTFASTPGLHLVRELRTPLYRVHLFCRELSRRRHSTAPRELISRDAVLPSDPEVYGRINWDGCAITGARAYTTNITRQLPILMYHRIASHGPEELARYRVSPENFERQLAYLKRQGYANIGLDEWVYALSAQDGRLPGRLVCLTFDDGYRDFREHAWPLLQRYGFSATVFLPTDFVGRCAEWDRNFGEPADLMSWDDIRALAKEGVTFGAHGAGHRRLNQLSVTETLAEGRLSREKIAAELGCHVNAMAYPYGGHSDPVRRATESCGFGCAVTTDPGLSRLGDDHFGLPRQEILGVDKIDDLVAKLGPPEQATIDRRMRYYVDRWTRRNLWRC